MKNKTSYKAWVFGLSFGTIFGAVFAIAGLDILLKSGEKTREQVRLENDYMKFLKRERCWQEAKMVKVVAENRDMGFSLEKHLTSVVGEAHDLIVWTYANKHIDPVSLSSKYEAECLSKI